MAGVVFSMEDWSLPAGLTALAVAIAREVPDPNVLALLSAMLVQLGDTLATLAASQAVCQARQGPLTPGPP